MTAVTHGINNEHIEAIKSRMEADNIQIPQSDPNAKLILPNPPVQQMHSTNQESPNWPLLTVSRDFFEVAMLSRSQNAVDNNEINNSLLAAAAGNITDGDWGEDADMQIEDEDEHFEDAKDDGEAGWDIDDNLEISNELLNDVSLDNVTNSVGAFIPPPSGKSPVQAWSDNSGLAVDQVIFVLY